MDKISVSSPKLTQIDQMIELEKIKNMGTLTAQKPEIIVNFFNIGFNDKRPDWRFEEYEKLERKEDSYPSSTIYWIGIVHLLPVRTNVFKYPLSFLQWGKRMIEDTYVTRDVDGAPMGVASTMYYLEKISSDLLKAREEGKDHYQIFLEETVNVHGAHQVNLLYSIGKGEKPLYGIATKKPWFDEPVIDWIDYASTKLGEQTKRICILGNEEYHWLK